ncbi:hypothetical protein ZTR_03499 [Talaromyces verruculosus]|nr:hypothetical protein ZTR_03499 [Talaromyces verruculosus]
MGTIPALVVEYTRGSVSAENAGSFLDAFGGIRVFAFFTAGYVFEYVLPDRYAAADAGAAFTGVLSYNPKAAKYEYSNRAQSRNVGITDATAANFQLSVTYYDISGSGPAQLRSRNVRIAGKCKGIRESTE